MGGHSDVYAVRSALMSVAFSSKPKSYTGHAANFGVPPSMAEGFALVDRDGAQLVLESRALRPVGGDAYITGLARVLANDALAQRNRVQSVQRTSREVAPRAAPNSSKTSGTPSRDRRHQGNLQ